MNPELTALKGQRGDNVRLYQTSKIHTTCCPSIKEIAMPTSMNNTCTCLLGSVMYILVFIWHTAQCEIALQLWFVPVFPGFLFGWCSHDVYITITLLELTSNLYQTGSCQLACVSCVLLPIVLKGSVRAGWTKPDKLLNQDSKVTATQWDQQYNEPALCHFQSVQYGSDVCFHDFRLIVSLT